MEETAVLNGNVKLYDELGELARYLDSAMRKMAEVGDRKSTRLNSSHG